MRLTVLGVALLASASAVGEGYITSVRLPDGTTKTFQDAGARQEIQDIKSDLDPLLFAQYYPDGSVKSAAEFTSGIKYDAPDTTNRTITVKPFCNTGTAANDNSNLSGRVVIPPFVDASGNGYISDDGTRYKVVGVSGGVSGAYNQNLTAIVAPNTVTTIGTQVFDHCTGLSSVSLPAATDIGISAFGTCWNLVTVSSPAATNIWDGAFFGCSCLTSISLPAATDIGGEAFSGCTALASVDFGDTPRTSVPLLGSNAFSYVPTACKIVVPDAQYDAWIAASGWSSLVTRGYKFLKHSEWEYARKYEVDKKADKPATFTTGNLAEFDSQGNPIDSFIAATNVALKTDISPTEPAFSNAVLAVGLGIDTNTVAAINELVDSTHGLPVTGAASVGALLLALAAAIAALKRGKASKSDLALRPTMFDIGGGVWVFANDGEGFVVSNGEVTTLPASKTRFEQNEYGDNDSITTVYAPNVDTVGNGAFFDCNGLSSILLPAATTIGVYAFSDCNRLSSILLPAATNIGINAFDGCSALTSLDLSSFTVAQVQANAATWGINPPSGQTVTITCSDGTFTITGD